MELYTDAGACLMIAGAGRSGGEGTVYPLTGAGAEVVKVYHPHRAGPEREAKVRAMVARPPHDPAWDARRHRSIAWPTGLVWHDVARTRFAGFMMPTIDAGVFREAHTIYDPGDRIARFGGAFTWRHLLTAAMNLASSVAAIHAEGHRVGDLRETNLLVAPTALTTLIDCDSFQVLEHGSGRVHHTRVGTADYLPPELHGADFGRDHDRTGADLFALAVLVFRFLMQGVHPFQATGRRVDDAPTTADKIARGAFPYGRARGVAPPSFAPSFDAVPPDLRRLFERCFVAGHRRPARRPTAAEWHAALRGALHRITACAPNPNHVFGGHLRRCPWCAMARDGFDPFPGPRAAPTAGPAAVVRRAPPPSSSPSSISAPAPVSRPSLVGMARWLGFARSVRVARALGPRGAWRVCRALIRPPGRASVTPRRTVALLAIALVPVLLVSPLGHSAEAPDTRTMDLGARVTGPCPRAPDGPAADCVARWRVGPVHVTTQRARSFFVLRREHVQIEVDFAVRFDGTACTVPWIDHRSFNASRPAVCLGTCPEAIEVRARDGRSPLVGVTGVAARGGPLPCGARHTGSWTFDLSGLHGSMRLHYPSLEPISLPG